MADPNDVCEFPSGEGKKSEIPSPLDLGQSFANEMAALRVPFVLIMPLEDGQVYFTTNLNGESQVGLLEKVKFLSLLQQTRGEEISRNNAPEMRKQ